LCDNKTVVKSTNEFQRYGTTLKDIYSADYDVLGEIGRIWKILRAQVFIKIKHIMGHPDRHKKQLTHKEELNVEADLLATSSFCLKKICGNQLQISKCILKNKQIISNIKAEKKPTKSILNNGL
jgi:hypothetical protein